MAKIKKDKNGRWKFKVIKEPMPNPDYDDRFIRKVLLKSEYMSEGICDSYLKWTKRTPVLINSGTGTGKTTFCENVLIEHANKNGLKILFLTNRKASINQMKRRVAALTNCQDTLELYSEKGLEKLETFGCFTIKTYQKFLNELEKTTIYRNKFDIVCFDEVHFFISDCLFNNKTTSFIQAVKAFKDSIRVYLTATESEIIGFIVNAESNIDLIGDKLAPSCDPTYSPFNRRHLIHYYFNEKNKYKNINHLYFDDVQEVIEEIKKDSSKSKWIVNVSDMNIGNKFLNSIDGAVFIDASSKDSSKIDGVIYNEIVTKEKFSCKVLITTAVLDTGLNLKDPELVNIVIMTHDKSQFLQIMGRKRKLQENETLNLFLPAKSVKWFAGKVYSCNQKFEAISMYKSNLPAFMDAYYFSGNTAKFDIIKHLFNKDRSMKPVLNHIAETKLYNDKKFFEEMICKLEYDKAAFIKTQLSWLGLEKNYSASNWLSYNEGTDCIKAFRNFLESNVGKSMNADEFDIFGWEFKDIYEAAYGTSGKERGDRVYGVCVMRKKLKILDFNYTIACKKSIYTLARGKADCK